MFGGLGDAAGDDNMGHSRGTRDEIGQILTFDLQEFSFLLTAPMGFGIACTYRYAVKL